MAHIKGRGYSLAVKGEDGYTSTLRKCFHHPNAERCDEKSVIIPVKINTKGDVISGFGKIGELAWDDLDWYFELYGKTEHTADCRIYTRTGELFGAWLSVTLTEFTAPKLLAKNLSNVDINLVSNSSNKKHDDVPTINNEPLQINMPKPLKEPMPPPKPWSEQSRGEKIGTVLALLFLLGVIYVVYRIVAWFFRLIF